MDITKYYCAPDEKPLDVIKPDGGFTGIFRTIACVGDSLSSGEFEAFDKDNNRSCHDMYEYSWGQYMARAAGCKVYNFSVGGMTAKAYLEGWGESAGVWDPEKACQAYIFALGCNDLSWANIPLGCADDIDPEHPENCPETFAGYMCKLLARYKEIQPKARFFLISMPRETTDEFVPSGPDDYCRPEKHHEIMHALAEKFEFTYVIDLYKYGPVYDAEFKRNFYMSGHLNAQGYMLTAHMVMSYIDYIIRKYPEDFTQVPFIGTPIYNVYYKW